MAKVWFANFYLVPRPDTWRILEPSDRIRERKEPFRDEQGRIIPPGPLGKYFEYLNDQGTWKSIRPGDIRRIESSQAPNDPRSPFDPEVPPSVAAAQAKAEAVYELRIAKGGVEPRPNVSCPGSHGCPGQFLIEEQLKAGSPVENTEIHFASVDFSLQAIQTVGINDPDRPLTSPCCPYEMSMPVSSRPRRITRTRNCVAPSIASIPATRHSTRFQQSVERAPSGGMSSWEKADDGRSPGENAGLRPDCLREIQDPVRIRHSVGCQGPGGAARQGRG